MTDAGLLGIPWPIWGILCLGVSLAYFWFWPKPQPDVPRSPLSAIVLRWFHGLVWLVLAFSAFMNGGLIGGGRDQAFRLALFAVVLYLVFIMQLIGERVKQAAIEIRREEGERGETTNE